MEAKEIIHGVTAGPARDQGSLMRLPREGFSRVIDLRTEGETDPLSPAEEADLLQDADLEHVHLPVDWKDMGYDQADRILAAIDGADGPVYIHSTSGKRAAAMVVIDRAIRKGLNPKEAVRQAEALGAIQGGTTADVFIAGYVAERVGVDIID